MAWKATVCSWFLYLITTEYERIGGDNTSDKIKEVRMTKLKVYVGMCMFGLMSMNWGGAEVLVHMNRIADKGSADNCFRFLTVAYVSALFGMTAGTLHSTAPRPLFFSGLGAWLSFLFMLAVFHLDTGKFHLKQEHATYSFCISSFLLSLFWSYAAQDPLPLHSAGKLLVSIACNFFFLARWLWRSKGVIGGCFLRVVCCFGSPKNLLPRITCRES